MYIPHKYITTMADWARIFPNCNVVRLVKVFGPTYTVCHGRGDTTFIYARRLDDYYPFWGLAETTPDGRFASLSELVKRVV